MVLFLSRTEVPIQQNFLIDDRQTARGVRRGGLALAVCESCGFISNRAFALADMAYGESYDNTQTCSPIFETYVRELADTLVRERGVRNCRIIEVGCGKGGFLRRLVAAEGAGNRGVGFDPSYVGPPHDLNGRLRYERCYFDGSGVEATANVIVCRHVIEHVPDPVSMLAGMRRALAPSLRARVFLETPCVDWILEHRVVWDFFYEHCSYFSAASLRSACVRAGLQVESVKHVFGGQYLWVEASAAQSSAMLPLVPGRTPTLARDFAKEEAAVMDGMGRRLRMLAHQGDGRVAVWGAGAKGVTFANLLDPDCQRIACVVDLNCAPP